MKVLVHLRPGEKDFYLKLVNMAFPDDEIITVSDENGSGMIWFGQYLYNDTSNAYFDTDTTNDIIMRCRFLRKIDRRLAVKLINNLACGLDSLFAESHLSVVVGGLVDCYTQDVLERIACKHEVLYVSFVGHFFTGYARITSRGELRQFPREVSDQEIKDVLNKISVESFKPDFKLNKEKSVTDVLYYYGRELIKKHVYFPLKKLIKNDKHNYHYSTTISTRFNLASINTTMVNSFFVRIADIENSINSNSVYLPLHFIPEATIDYWADNCNFALQEESILRIVAECAPNIQIILKEHPAMYMLRNIEFYKKILKHKNVVLVHPYESSNLLLNLVDNVCVFTGSVGVEALIRGKRVLTFTNNYYSNLHPNIIKISNISSEVLNIPINEYSNEEFVKTLLQGLIKLKFYNNKKMFESDMELMSDIIKKYVNYELGKKYASKS